MKELKSANVWFVFLASVLLGSGAVAFGGNSTNGQTDPFDESFVHEIRIELDPEIWELMRSNDRDYRRVPQPATVTFDDIPPLEEVGVATAFLRRHDPNSYLYPNLRLGFGVFRNDQRLLGVRGFDLKGFVSDDNSLIAERLAWERFDAFDVPASRTTYARLIVNGEYIGAYTMIESISDMVARRFGNIGGNLYKLKNTALSRYGNPDAFALAPENPDDPRSYIAEQRSDRLPFEKPSHRDYYFNDPDGRDLVRLIRAFNEATPSTVRLQVSQLLDLNSLIDLLAVDMALSDTDCLISYDPRGSRRIYFQNNTFFYNPDPTNPDPTRRRFVLIPDDLDGAFDAFDYQSFNRDLMDGWDLMRITRLLLHPDNADLKDRYLDRVQDFVNQFYDPNDVIARIDLLRDQIRDDVREDLERPDPPPEGTRRMTVAEWLERVERLKRYVRDRAANLQRQLYGP